MISTPERAYAAERGAGELKASSEKVFKAGAATNNITPPLGGGIVGNFGTPPEAVHVNDELHNRCLVLDDGENRLVFVVVDNISIRRNVLDEAKRIIEEETSIPTSNILISAIHTHSSVSASGVGAKRSAYIDECKDFDEYQQFLIRRIADVVRIAINNLEPAKIGWGVGSVPEHVFVRRWILKEPAINPYGEYDKVQFNPGRANRNKLCPESEPDPEVSFISVRSKDERPIALLANYSLHYVGGVPRDHISADYFAVFADRIQELLNADRQHPPFVGIMSNGTSGNVNNINYAAEAERHAPYEKIRIVADDVAREVLRVEGGIKYSEWVPLDAFSDELTLKVRKPDKKLIERSKAVLNRSDDVEPIHRLEKSFATRILRLLEWPDEVSVVIQTFSIGDLAVAAIPFEVFSDTGMELKAKSPFETTFTIELANGSYGYLPIPECYERGGYETWWGVSRMEQRAATKITDKLLEQFEELKSR